MGSIEGIYKASHCGLPMESVNQAILLQGVGIEGDRYAQNIGTYSVFRTSAQRPGEREPGRQLTLVSADSVRATLLVGDGDCGAGNVDVDVDVVGNLRRNITITGISAQQLLDAIGHVIQIGDTCRILPHRNCVPCMYLEKKNKNIPKLMTRLWYQAGVSCEVLQGGTISVGDAVKILLDDDNDEKRTIDPGKQYPGFFLHPSQRTAEMAKQGVAHKMQARQELEKMDPRGVERVAQSYASVGLSFWPTAKK
jgi:MOSC domain-containing protein YiiM